MATGTRLASMEQIHETLTRITRLAGFKNPRAFWIDPKELPPPEPAKPTPEEVEAETNRAEMLEKAALERQKLMVEREQNVMQFEADLAKIAADGNPQVANQARENVVKALVPVGLPQ